jgi:excisionase family DNA binding protein
MNPRGSASRYNCKQLAADLRRNGMEWITRRTASERLGVSVATVDRWIRDGKLEASRLTPGTVRVSVFSIDQLIQRGKAG